MKKRSWYLTIGGILTALMLAFTALGLFWTPYSPTAVSAPDRSAPPCAAHPFGCDQLGRDVLSRTLEGAGATLTIALAVLLVGAVCGLAVGALCGYYGGPADALIMRVCDAVAAFPSVLLAMVVLAVTGPGRYHVIEALGVLFIPSFARLVRGEFLKYRDRDFVRSARLMGVGGLRIIFVHILPNTWPTLLSGLTIGFNNAVLAEASMSYLGIGVSPSEPSLGYMLKDAQGALFTLPWCTVFPGLAAVLLILGVGLVGEGIRERMGGFVMMLDVQDLSVVFTDRGEPFTAVDRFCLQMEEGEIVGVVGESGSGKSMTAHALMGLIRRSQVAVTGRALFRGTDLLALSREELRRYQGRDLSIIFQEPMTSLNPTMRIGAQVEESLRIHERLSPSERKARALDAMALAGLADPQRLYRQYPHQLSGGMRQRVMIAAALVLRPRLLIADEPTTALDVTIQAQILDTLRDINRREGTAILFISHDLGVVKALCSRVAVMRQGKIVESGPVDQVFYHPREDYTRLLIASRPGRKKLRGGGAGE